MKLLKTTVQINRQHLDCSFRSLASAKFYFLAMHWNCDFIVCRFRKTRGFFYCYTGLWMYRANAFRPNTRSMNVGMACRQRVMVTPRANSVTFWNGKTEVDRNLYYSVDENSPTENDFRETHWRHAIHGIDKRKNLKIT